MSELHDRHWDCLDLGYSGSSALVWLDNGEGIKNVPFHAHNYPLRETRSHVLVGLVNQFVSAYKYAKQNNALNHFYDKLYGGNCIEGRTRDLFDWLRDANSQLLLDVVDELRKVSEDALGYLAASGSVTVDNVTKRIYQRLKSLRFKPQEDYAPKGCVTMKTIRSFVVNVLAVDEDEGEDEASYYREQHGFKSLAL